MAVWLMTIGGMLALVYLARFCGAAESWPRTWVKTGALGLPALGLALAGWPAVFVAGLAACVLGDFLLSRPGQRALMAGIGAFALGHLLYVLAFVQGFALHAPLAAALALVALGLSTRWWLLPHAGALRGPVAGYVLVILAMGVAAAATGQAWLMLGAGLFILSDLVLAVELFRRPAGLAGRLAPYAIWGLYIAGQAGLIAGMAP